MLSPSLELSLVGGGTAIATAIAAAGDGVDPNTIVGGGGAAVLLILVQILNNGVKSWVTVNDKRGELMDAQMADLAGQAEERSRRSAHRKAERAYWQRAAPNTGAHQAVPTQQADVPTQPIELDSGHFPAAVRR